MINSKWQRKMNQYTRAKAKADELLKIIENEYVGRFNVYPSEVDDDFWIDSFHIKACGASVAEVIESATLHKSINL